MMRNLEIGQPVFLSNMTVYPLFGDEQETEVTFLEEEVKRQRAKILETKNVNSLEVDYQGNQEMLIIQGEEIVGAMQNRIFATSLLLPRGRERVPVYCVEAGRWRGSSDELQPSGYIAYPRIRSILTSSHIKREIQNTIWKEISRKQESMRIKSTTQAMTESFKEKQEELNFYAEYTPQEDQIGFMVFSNLRFLGLDIFANSTIFLKFMEKLLISYGLDALEDRMSSSGSSYPQPHRIIKIFKEASFKEESVPGIGKELRAITRLLVIRKLIKEGIVLHASVFSK